MIIIGPFIIVINNHYGPTQDEPPPENQPPERITKDTSNMHHVKCDAPGCEWEDYYDTPGKAGQGLGVHKSWCNKGKRFKKHPFGLTHK